VENYSQKQIEKRFLERKRTPDMKREKGSGNRVRAKDFAAIHIQIYILLFFWICIRIPIELAKD
jgi:hypothetical protein